MESRNGDAYVETDPSGRYGRFGEILGRGATKTVYRAFDEVLGMEVAWIQVIVNGAFSSPDHIKRLGREVDLLKKLKHEYILRFYTSWIDNDNDTRNDGSTTTRFNFITEMFTSGTLRSYRQKYKRVEIEGIKRWARQILQGLVYLHSRDPPVIHRDLKCDNIFVNGHLAQVKIGDFGLATVLHGSQPAHSVLGTPEFMAPELYKEEYNELVDVYSFGMCVLEMLTSEYPYSECLNFAQIYKKVTLRKKPNVYYRIQDIKAQQFIAKCLEVAEKRPSACQLLLDPFLANDESLLPDSVSPLQIYPTRGGEQGDEFGSSSLLLMHHQQVTTKAMTFSGELKPDGKTIFLTMNIIDSNGHARSVQFSLDVVEDKATDVATEMVNELDITDWEPQEIAEMIESEMSAIFPTWREYIQEKEATENIGDDNKTNEIEPGSSFSNKDDEISSSSRALGSSRFHSLDENTKIVIGGEGNSMILVKEKAKPNAEKKPSKRRSFNDIGRQVLQKLALKQGRHKRQSSKTTGSIEGIGFQAPGRI